MCEFLAVSFPGANSFLKSMILYVRRQKFTFKTLESFLSTLNQFLKQIKFLQLILAFIYFFLPKYSGEAVVMLATQKDNPWSEPFHLASTLKLKQASADVKFKPNST